MSADEAHRFSEFTEAWGELKTKGEELELLKSQIENVDAQYQSLGSLPDNVIQDRNKKVEQHNEIAAAYSNLRIEAQKLYDEYQKEIETHNALVESYNKRAK